MPCRSYTLSEPAWLLEVQGMEKFLSNIVECGKFLTENCKEYLLNVDEGLDHIKLLVAHITTLKQVQVADIEETDTYAIDPDAKSKLVYCIRKEIEVESSSITKVLCQGNSSVSLDFQKLLELWMAPLYVSCLQVVKMQKGFAVERTTLHLSLIHI
ncbi:UNVERIFIED_CONTAM: hypothetical protein NCL1_27817 [Trichonephila clavipes]